MDTTTKEAYSDAPHMRLLVCRTCKVLEELPDWQGHPDDDPFLGTIVQKHPDHKGQLFRLPIGLWLMEEAAKVISKQIIGGSEGLAAFDEKFYDTRNTFQEDAMSCFKAHNSPEGQCPDFNSEKKELKPDTGKDRKDAGLPILRVGPKVHLCSFCPVRLFNERKARGE